MSQRGHRPGTAATATADRLAAQGESRRLEDRESSGFGRLLTLEQAAAYLGVSPWLLRQYIQAGQIEVTRLPRPATASATRGRRPSTDPVRLTLVDRRVLDEWVDTRCTRERVAAGIFPQRGAAA